jgi:hypothetical protein
VRLFFREGKGRCQQNEREDEGNQGFHEDQPIDPWGLAKCHRRGSFGNFRLWIPASRVEAVPLKRRSEGNSVRQRLRGSIPPFQQPDLQRWHLWS